MDERAQRSGVLLVNYDDVSDRIQYLGVIKDLVQIAGIGYGWCLPGRIIGSMWVDGRSNSEETHATGVRTARKSARMPYGAWRSGP